MAIDSKQDAIHFKYCVDRNIRIYPQPIRPGEMKIVVETNGVPKIGTMIFLDKPPTGQISVWDKIRELYKTIYDREILKETNNTQ